MMTLNEAIQHCLEKEEELKKEATIELNEKFGNSFYDCLECARGHGQLAEWLKELRALRKENQELRDTIYDNDYAWIPASERLPEESDFYLVTIADKDQTYVTTLFFMKSTPDMWEHDKKIIAWKPLPEPYKENNNGKS